LRRGLDRDLFDEGVLCHCACLSTRGDKCTTRFGEAADDEN
jgi:hypothetical protein